MHVKNIKRKYRKGGKRKVTKRRKYQDGGVPSLIPNLPVQQIAQNVTQPGIQTGGGTIAGELTQGLGSKLRSGLEGAGMQLAGAGQDALGSLKDGLKGGKIGLAGAAALLGAGADKLISKGSGTANDAFRTDKKQKTGAAVGGAIKGAGKGFDIGNKIIPGLGGVIGGALGAVGGAFKSKRSLEKDRKASVRALRETQSAQLKAEANRPDAFSAKAGAGFNTATSRTKAYDQASRARKGGVRKLPGGVMSSLPGGAVEFKGQTHEQGGIMLDKMTEVETGETMDKVNMKKSGGKAKDYIFSDYLKLGGKTFAARHKEILKRGGSQQKIQELAKLQEKKANRSPKVMQEGGEREGGTSDLLKGLAGFNVARTDGSTAEEELNRAATDAANAYSEEEAAAINAEREAVLARNEEKRNVRAKQGSAEERDTETGEKIYGGNEEDNIGSWLGMMETDMGNLPEEFQTFDFSQFKDEEGNFDAASFNTQENKAAFREWYNNLPDDLVSGKLRDDGKSSNLIFGTQWNTRRLLERPDVPQAIERTDVKLALDMPEPVEGDTPTPDKTTEVTTKSRDVPLGAILAGASQLIPPAYSLLKKPKNVPGYAPQAYAKPQLPRVNYNAERAANASDTRATLASIENNAAGPAGMVNMIAAMGKKRQGDLEIATQESRANKQLSAEEARLGAQASQFNIGQDAQAQTFNRNLAREQIKDRREEVMGALDAAADRIAGMTGDVLDYKAQERLAEAVSGETGVLLRERLKGQINPTTGDPYTDIEIAALAGKLESEGTPPGAYGKVRGKRGGKEKNKKSKTTTFNAEGYEIDPATGELTGKGRRRKKRDDKKDPKKFGSSSPEESVEKNKKGESKPITQKQWDKMSPSEQIEYTKNETPEQAAQRRESGIGVVDTSKPDGTKVEGASLRREDVKRNYPDAQLGSFTNAKGQIIYYPIYDEGPSPDYRKGGYLKRRGRIKRKRR
jgi:hypothetical protein